MILFHLTPQIVDTVDFGRFLILDEMANLAESDTVLYTHTLMNLPHEDYKVGCLVHISLGRKKVLTKDSDFYWPAARCPLLNP